MTNIIHDSYKPRFSNEFQKVIHEAWIKGIRSTFGPLKMPVPEDFYITTDQMINASLAYQNNEAATYINKANGERRRILSKQWPLLGDFYGIFFIKNQRIDPLGERYAKYLRKMEDYRSIIEELEYEKSLEIERQKAAYWFSLNGFEFEKEIEMLFIGQFGEDAVLRTKGTGDGGIDLIISVDGNKVIVQCKAHKAPVGPHVVRDLYGVMNSERINRGLLISLGGVTRGAKEFIEGKNIDVFDVHSVIKMSEMISARK